MSDFLVHLFPAGLAIGTVRTYRSAIAAAHTGFADGSSISSNGAITQLLRGMFNERPPVRRLVPSWDLGRVPEVMASAPYEPPDLATLLQMSITPAFLIAASSARRGCEIHALSIQSGHIRRDPGGVRLVPRMAFLMKNQTAEFSPPDIFMPETRSVSSIRSDRLGCPVRYLTWYLARTWPLRGTCEQLACHNPPPLTAQRLQIQSRVGL